MMVSSTPVFAAHAVYAHWLLINIAFNYTMVVWTSPGYIKINKVVQFPHSPCSLLVCLAACVFLCLLSHIPRPKVSPADHEALMRSRSPYYCKKCMSRRPARAHHCSICGTRGHACACLSVSQSLSVSPSHLLSVSLSFSVPLPFVSYFCVC